MKKHLLLYVLMSLSAAVYAQEPDIVIKASNKVSKQSTPKQVIDSLRKRFPNAKAVQYYKTSPAGVKAGWVVSEEDNMEAGEDLDRYTLSFKRNDFKWYALFDASGNVLMSKYEEYGTKLPDAVRTKLLNMAGDNYKNYKLLSKTHYKQVNYGKAKDYYQVKAVSKTNAKDVKTVTLASDGTVLKES